MKLLPVSIVCWGLLCATPAWAQETAQAESDAQPTVIPDLDFYGSLRVHLANAGGTGSVDDNASRLGLEGGLTFGSVRPFVRVELGVNLVRSSARYNVDGNELADGFISIEQGAATSPFKSRLGYVGIEAGKWGTLTIGKQWGVYYDIAGWTDWFWVFGGEGHPTYSSGTDGGFTGTGRADQAVKYRVALAGLQFGLQGQFNGDQDDFVKSWGSSLIYAFESGLSIGAAYNNLFIDDDFMPDNLLGYDGNDSHGVIGGAVFKRSGLELAVTGSRSWNLEVIQPDTLAIVYDTWGIEAFARYRLRERLAVQMGYNQATPIDPYSDISPDFETKYISVGASFHFRDQVLVYTEEKFDLGHTVTGAALGNIYTLGIRYGFSTGALFDKLMTSM